MLNTQWSSHCWRSAWRFKCIIDPQARTSSRPRQSTARAPDSCYYSKLAANQDQDSKPNTDLKQVRNSSGWYEALLFRKNDLFQNIRSPEHLGRDCATSPTAARAASRGDSTLPGILRITLMTSTAPTCSLQPPVSRSHQSIRSHLRDDLCVSKI